MAPMWSWTKSFFYVCRLKRFQNSVIVDSERWIARFCTSAMYIVIWAHIVENTIIKNGVAEAVLLKGGNGHPLSALEVNLITVWIFVGMQGLTPCTHIHRRRLEYFEVRTWRNSVRRKAMSFYI